MLVFSPETHHPQNDLSVRVFADYYGVAEDPAGTINVSVGGRVVMVAQGQLL